MATIARVGKKVINTNNGKVKLNINDNRILHYDGTNYRFLVGDNNNNNSIVLMSKSDTNVLNIQA